MVSISTRGRPPGDHGLKPALASWAQHLLRLLLLPNLREGPLLLVRAAAVQLEMTQEDNITVAKAREKAASISNCK